MQVRIPITEATLRRAVGDPRYWSSGNPERQGFVDWVGEGYRSLSAPDGQARGTVFVRAYTRVVDGKPQNVSAYQRSAQARGDREGPDPNVVPAQAPLLLTPRAPLLFSRPPVGPRIPMERIPRQSGREAARDTPSWARGERRYVDETPTQFAERLMDRQYGGRQNWDSGPAARRQTSEFSRIKKFGERAFRNPRSAVGPDA